MKNEKLSIEDFLNNELKNQTKIVGGTVTANDAIIDIRPLGGGPSVTGGTGNVETNPTGSTGGTGTTVVNDPSKM